MRRWATREQRALAIATLTFLSLWGMGTIGWRMADPTIDRLEALYRALQMFSLNWTAPPGKLPPLLQFARFAEPAFTLLAFAATLSAQLRLVLRTLSTLRAEQVTVIGYGVAGKAAAERFRATRRHARIVALDHSVTEADHRAARRHGVELIECDVLDKEARDRFAIGLERSREVVIACGSDQTNLSLLDELGRQLTGSRHPVRLWLHLNSHRLAERLRESYGSFGARAPVVEFVEVADNAAQAVLLAHPLVPEARAAGLARVHAVIHGFDDFGWLSVEQVLLNGIFPAPTLTLPRITVVTGTAVRARAEWNARHPGLAASLDVRFLDCGEGAVGWGDAEDTLLARIEGELPPSIHIFAGADSEQALTAALALRDGMRRGVRSVAPIAVRSDHRRLTGGDLAEPSGVLQLRLTIVDGYDTPVSAFGLIGRVLEDRARAFHAAYAQDSAASVFDRMPHSQRLSNRRAAFHLLEKLRLLGFEGALPVDRAYGVAPAGLTWLRARPPAELEALDALENLRWRTDRLIEGWRAGPRNSERRLRDGLDGELTRPGVLSAAERGKDRSQLDDFLSLAGGAAGAGVSRICDIGWEGPPPRWTRTPDLHLTFDGAIGWPTEEPGVVCRLRLLVPPLPPDGGGADRDAVELRAALAQASAALLARAPAGARLRFVRAAAHPWNWLDPDPAGRVDGVTLPRFVVGFTGHRDPARLGDVDSLRERLTQELATSVPAGTELVSGLADGGDALMVRLWGELKLGPVTGVVPYLDENGASAGPDATDRVSDDLVRLCTTVEQPQVGLHASDDDRHVAVADAILQRATLLIAISDGVSGGVGGVEHTVARMRARGELVRYIDPARPSG